MLSLLFEIDSYFHKLVVFNVENWMFTDTANVFKLQHQEWFNEC